jgi:hypothetical protein
MSDLWLKIKIWTKISAFALLAIAVLIFVLNNINKKVTIWLWNDIDTALLSVVFFTVLISVMGTLLVRTIWKTVRQIQGLRARGQTGRLQREVADMKSKAAMLQTKPDTSPPAASGPSPTDVAPPDA